MPATVREIITFTYFALVSAMGIFAFHKVKMLLLYWRGRGILSHGVSSDFAEQGEKGELPRVCVQCPVYNEPLVIDALLDSVARLRWPSGRIEVQILDDSSDETTARILAWLACHPVEALHFKHVRRVARTGYKAGALAHGMLLSDAPFIAIFDADFRPEPDFLETLMPHFSAPGVGLVQARWEFNNRSANLLTRFQGIFLDAHFVIEQAARHTAGLFFNFNGTAGVWRRTALEEAGGWTPDTVTEDLDVSYRAQLRGWRFVYRGDYTVPSELPENVTAFKSQQRRWTKGGIQVMRKQLATILRSSVPARIKREASWHLLVGFIHPLLIAFALVLVPYFLWAAPVASVAIQWIQPAALVLTFWSAIGLYLAGRQLRKGAWSGALLILLCAPLILSFGLAMSVTNTVAVIEGFFQRGGEFVRTPKGGARAVVGGLVERLRSRGLFLGITLVEMSFGVIMLAGSWHFLARQEFAIAVLLGFKAIGFFGVALLSLRDLWPSRQLALPQLVPQC